MPVITDYPLAESNVDPGRLHLEIDADPAIIVAVSHIATEAGIVHIFMADVLPGDEEDALWVVVGGHVSMRLAPVAKTSVADGRLTLESGVAVSASDQLAKTSVYYTPFIGNKVGLYDGSSWRLCPFSELTLTVPATTDTNFDIFAYAKGNIPTLEYIDWTNDTTRATALAVEDGKRVKSGDATRRYLGTGRTTGVSGQIEDSEKKRLLWNEYNRAMRKLKVVEAGSSHTYTTATWRSYDADNTMRVAVVIGRPLSTLNLLATSTSSNSGGQSPIEAIGIGADRTNGQDADAWNVNNLVTPAMPSTAHLVRTPAIGHHFYQLIEWSEATGTATFFGFISSSTAQVQSGLVGGIDA